MLLRRSCRTSRRSDATQLDRNDKPEDGKFQQEGCCRCGNRREKTQKIHWLQRILPNRPTENAPPESGQSVFETQYC